MERYFKEHLNWLKDEGHYNPASDTDRFVYLIHNYPDGYEHLTQFVYCMGGSEINCLCRNSSKEL